MFVPHENVTRTRERPSEDSDVISSMPGTVATTSSMMRVTSRSITSELAPSYSVRIVTVGSSMFGSMSVRRRVSAATPSTITMSVTIEVKTGRFTLAAGRFTRRPSRCPGS